MLKNDIDELDVGDWCFVNGVTHIAIRLGPDQDRDCCVLPIAREGEVKQGTYWEWDGSVMEPTLKPSILHWGNGRDKPATWHGYLRAGKLVVA